MTRKKSSSSGKLTSDSKDRILQSKTGREEKVMNCIMNTSIILMVTMMGAFSELMVNTTSAMSSGIAEALGGKEAGEKVNEEVKQKLPEFDRKMKTMLSDIRKDIYTQLGEKSKEIKSLLSDPFFDIGPKIVGKYDFKLPKLTEELNDDALAHYSKLLVYEDPVFAEMFQELTSWLNSLPKFSEKTNV